jgi:hypothetical protein
MRRPTLFVMLLGVAFIAWGTEVPHSTSSDDILQQYLSMPHPKMDTMGEARSARLDVLAELGKQPDALPIIRDVLPRVGDPRRREELAELCGRSIQTKESAVLLSELLKDPDEQVRSQAVQGLRLMTRRVDRTGGRRIQRGRDHPPRVAGLVPTLILAANDSAETVRLFALFALADSCDPRAIAELRKRLKDPSRKIRFNAACLLTEFQDASGLPELKVMLDHLQKTDPKNDGLYWLNPERLLASLERITGKSFGEIPMNPMLCSSDNGEEKRYEDLLDAWTAWWNWRPTETEKQEDPNQKVDPIN